MLSSRCLCWSTSGVYAPLTRLHLSRRHWCFCASQKFGIANNLLLSWKEYTCHWHWCLNWCGKMKILLKQAVVDLEKKKRLFFFNNNRQTCCLTWKFKELLFSKRANTRIILRLRNVTWPLSTTEFPSFLSFPPLDWIFPTIIIEMKRFSHAKRSTNCFFKWKKSSCNSPLKSRAMWWNKYHMTNELNTRPSHT